MNDTRIFVSWDTAHPPTGPAILAVGPGFEYCFHFPGKSALEARAILDRAIALADAAQQERLTAALLDEKEKVKRIHARVGALMAAMRARVAEAKALAAAAEQKAQARRRSADADRSED